MLKNYFDGKWMGSDTQRHRNVINPSTEAILARVPISTAHDVERAIQSAATAFEDWRTVSVDIRIEYLRLLISRLKEDEERICHTLVSEMGKSLPEARGELGRVYQNIEAACSAPMVLQGTNLQGVAAGVDVEMFKEPLGICGIIAPFNFPAMVPFWFLPYAIAAGNTVILKPSEQVPCTMQIIAEHIDEIGLPPGVFNLIHGDKSTAEVLVGSSDVASISIVGSTKVVHDVAKECLNSGKRYQALGGAKNHLVVMPDAHMDITISNILSSAFGCSGQRCMAASVVVCVGNETYEEVCVRLKQATENLVVDDPLSNHVLNERFVMGPVISSESKQFILEMIQSGVDEGAKLLVDGRQSQVPEKGYFVGPTIFTDVAPHMRIYRTEIFGPVLSILRVNSLADAIRLINDHAYGNGASIYTQNHFYARKFKVEANAGMLGVNIGVPAPVAYFPFGGVKDSSFSDLKTQGSSSFDFFTKEKVSTERFIQPE